MTTVPARVAWLTDTLLAPATEGVASAELSVLRADLVRDLQALGAELPAGERLQMDGYKIRTAHRNPERCMSFDTFVPSPRSTRRAVGVVAVNRCVHGHSPSPAGAVGDVLAEGVEDVSVAAATAGVRAPWWASWYAGLSGGARAVVCAEAVTWATQLLTAVHWSQVPRPVIGGRDDWWPCPGGTPIVLKGRAEVRSLVGRRPALLVVGTGRCQADWRIELGYPGLVAALGRDAPVAPCRVVGVWPQSGQVRVLPVDVGALRSTATAVVAGVATWVDSRIEAQRRGAPGAPDAVAVSVDGAVA
ncbi:MAG TPA: hypothetical protein VMU64_08815 [Acidimicrobiales bacterium]|nr:hypothetical protein [Acidimicrobiales bacterium]